MSRLIEEETEAVNGGLMFVCAAPCVFIWLSDGANLAPDLMSVDRAVKIRSPSPKPHSGKKKLKHKLKPSPLNLFQTLPKPQTRK